MGTVRRRQRPAEHLVARLGIDAFRAGAEGTIEVLPAGSTSLPPVQCWLTREDGGAFSMVPLRQRLVPVQRPLGMPDQGPGLLTTVHHPPLRITRLRRAVCAPGGIIVSGGAILAESFSATWDAHQHRHLHRAANGWHLTAWPELAPDRLPLLRGPVLYLDHQHIDWFGHVLLDLLAPAWAFEFSRAYLDLGKLRVICSRPRYDFVLRILEAAGMDRSTVVLIDAPVLCEELLVATKAFQIQEYTSPPAVRLWHAMSARVAGPAPSPSGRIYVSRSLNPTRRLAEEAAVEHVFERHGFRIFHPELFDVATQIKVFAGAELIAGCSGSNMFGMAFQARARAILILVSPLLVHYSEQLLHSSHEDCRLTVVIGFVRSAELAAMPGNVHCDWHLDVRVLEPLIHDWVDEHGRHEDEIQSTILPADS